jgi:hypothetical protein
MYKSGPSCGIRAFWRWYRTNAIPDSAVWAARAARASFPAVATLIVTVA